MENSHDQRLGYWLKLAQHALRNRMEEDLRALGLTLSQYAVLSELERRPDLTNADLAVRAFITPQSMQGVLANLEKSRLVERRSDLHHGRRQLARLTDAGAKRVVKAHEAVQKTDESLKTAAAPFSETEVRALFERILKTLTESDK